jgi:hypothetical protein
MSSSAELTDKARPGEAQAGAIAPLHAMRPSDAMHPPSGGMDAQYVIARFEEAGASLLALPRTGWSTGLRSSTIEIVRTAIEAYGWTSQRIRPPIPSADRISRMDETMSWLQLIPADRYVLRRVVGARSLVHPITERHLFSWRRLAGALGADHKAVQRWHAQAIDMIVDALNRRV